MFSPVQSVVVSKHFSNRTIVLEDYRTNSLEISFTVTLSRNYVRVSFLLLQVTFIINNLQFTNFLFQ